MLTLALDASTYSGSVAVLRHDDVLAERDTAMRGATEERLMPAVVETLSAAGVTPTALDRIVCGSGPGSFTSLRIAAAIAKGLATGLDRPLFAISSLVLLVAASARPAGTYLAALGALRGELFVQEVEVSADHRAVAIRSAQLMPEAEVEPCAAERGARLIGPGMPVDALPHARGVARLGAGMGLEAPVDLIAWEPRYGRAAEAQVRWEAAHGRPLPDG